MERIGEIISRTDLTRKSPEPTAISPLLPPPSLEEAIEFLRASGAPEWTILVLQLAQDKRHDLAPHTIRLWTEKLKSFSDAAICDALITGQWLFFPSVDDILIQIEFRQERLGQEIGNSSWQRWKAEQKRAEDEGLLATEEDYALMRKRLRELFGDPTVKFESKAG